MSTCREIREELRPIYYSNNVFVLPAASEKSQKLCEDELGERFHDWLYSIGEDGCGFLQTLMLSYCTHDYCGKMDGYYWKPYDITPIVMEISELGGCSIAVLEDFPSDNQFSYNHVCIYHDEEFLSRLGETEGTVTPKSHESPTIKFLLSKNGDEEGTDDVGIATEINIAPKATLGNQASFLHGLIMEHQTDFASTTS